MKRRKVNPKVQSSGYIQRGHYICRIRADLLAELKKACERLNCSQGVFLEIALSKVLLADVVKPSDVFSYDASRRWFDAARARLMAGEDWQGKQITDDERIKMIDLFARVVAGEIPVDSEIVQKYKKMNSCAVALYEFILNGTQEIPVASRPALRKKDLLKLSQK